MMQNLTHFRLCVALFLVATVAALPAMANEPTDEATPAEAKSETMQVSVGQATLTWHLSPNVAPKAERFGADFRAASRAHLLGEEPFVSKRSEGIVLPGGQQMFRLPAEMMHSMFVRPEGHSYCSDSTVTHDKSRLDLQNVDGSEQ